MKTTVAILSLLLAPSVAQANGLANRAAEIFERACLSEPVLSIGSGSNADDGAVAASYASNVFAHYDANGATMGLKGTPTYTLKSSRTEGSFTCYVVSKDLTARDVVKKFNRLKKVAGNGQSPTYVGPAKFDDAPERFIEGKRAEFESEGRKLQLELFYFISDKGPVGALYLTLEHKVSR
ncbi:hypothetical protein NBRC116594_38960 [Shimia sp. NS0008-38b]|uniref:hypothetical protein n=1 Tax=Shimia sp. NS0008-38b TaxID=3127653 RepID=UPI003107BE69